MPSRPRSGRVRPFGHENLSAPSENTDDDSDARQRPPFSNIHSNSISYRTAPHRTAPHLAHTHPHPLATAAHILVNQNSESFGDCTSPALGLFFGQAFCNIDTLLLFLILHFLSNLLRARHDQGGYGLGSLMPFFVCVISNCFLPLRSCISLFHFPSRTRGQFLGGKSIFGGFLRCAQWRRPTLSLLQACLVRRMDS